MKNLIKSLALVWLLLIGSVANGQDLVLAKGPRITRTVPTETQQPVVFANRVLTDQERQTLLTNESFLQYCQWAVRNYAAYWSEHSGAGLNDSDREKWRKDKSLSIGFLKRGISDNHLTEAFLNSSKGKQFDLAPAPLDAATLVSAWVTANAFEEFVAAYFTLRGSEID